MTKTNAPESTSAWLPWSWCNLRRNPFGELSRTERAELAIFDAAAIIEHLRYDEQAVQFIGNCGRGKTTRMLALLEQLPDASYTYLAEGEPCGPIPAGRPVMIDEAQRLPRIARDPILASRLPLVLATHRDLSRPLRRAGYRVTTHTIGEGPDADLVCRIMNRRIEAARLGAGDVPTFTLEHADQLVAEFGSDIRSMEAYLYEMVQQQKHAESQHGEMRFID